jgi:prepilin-type N-terminal cleavage/methylation domain-containing protein
MSRSHAGAGRPLEKRPRSRAGFTLVELLVAVVIAGIVMIAIYQVLVTTQQVSTMQTEQVSVQQTLRAGMNVLAQELRETSANGGDVLLAEADRVRMRALRSFGVICALGPGSNEASVATYGGQFDQGAPVFVFQYNEYTTADVDFWSQGTLVDLPQTVTCGAENLPGQRLGFSSLSAGPGGAPALLHIGAAVRSFRQVEYHLEVVDGQTFLARTQDGTTARLVGPLNAQDGVEFVYRDANGNTTTTPSAVRSVEITLRTTSQARRFGGQRPVAGTLTSTVTLRN